MSVSRPVTKKRLLFRSIAVISGSALLAYLIWRTGPGILLRNISTLGWGLALIIALGGVVHLVKTWAWRLTFTGYDGRVSFFRLLQLRLASEAVGQIGALGQIFGEGLRFSALDTNIPIESRISSVTLDRGMFIVSSALVSLMGIFAALLAIPLNQALRSYALLFAIALFGALSVVVLAMLNRWPFVSGSARLIGRLRFLRHRVAGALPLIHSVENKLFDFHRYTPRAFWASLLLNLACHGMAVFEVYLILWLMGFKIGLLGALVFEALTKLLNGVGVFNPGNIGTYEGGNVLIARLFSLPGAVGLSVAVSRRLRSVYWAAVGGVCLAFLSRSKAHEDSSSTSSSDIADTATSVIKDQESSPKFTCVICAETSQGLGGVGSSQLCVGTLPVLLRIILSVRRAVRGRIIVCVDPLTGRDAQHDLTSTRRLPSSVEWQEATSDMPFTQLLKQIARASEDDRLTLVAGNRTYHPALFRQAVGWNEKNCALALTTADRPAGIWVLPRAIALDAVNHCSSGAWDPDRFHAWLIATYPVECEPIEEGLWQQVSTATDCVAAEKKLDRWLVKPTDGIFARMNRRISVPISRQLIKLPITPNMVSLFTLGVGIAAGALFACGGYWNTLTGAVLSVWASILDGCDGEVARLKLLESDFGCWLETICDYLYYLLIFAGMAIGLIRTSDGRAYLIWGVLLLFGALMSFLVTGFGRHLLAAGRPEQYLGIWQAKAESRRSNPIMYFGRYTEFVIRRCFMPYALLFFAVFNLTKVVFFLAAIGANVVWLISLYSYCGVAIRRSPIRDSVVSTETSA
jgi:phosphatidylglycerophosphate synthase